MSKSLFDPPRPPLEVAPEDEGFYSRGNIFALFVGSGMFVVVYLLVALSPNSGSGLLFVFLPLVSSFTVGMLTPQRKMIFGSCYFSLFLNLVLGPFMLVEGLFCVIMAAPIFAVVTALGALMAKGIRSDIEKYNPQPWRRPPTQLLLLISAALCAGSIWDEIVLRRGAPVEVVRSEFEITAPRGEVWKRLSFDREPVAKVPLWLRLWVKQPERYAFANTGLGALRATDFGPPRYGDDHDALRNKLVYEIVEWKPDEAVDFALRENHSRMRFWVELLDTRVEFADAGTSATRVVMTTRYRRKIGPATYFTPFLNAAVGGMHTMLAEEIGALPGHE